MLFLIEFDTDAAAIGSVPGADLKALVQQEWSAGLESYRKGQMLRTWFKANGGGAVGVFDFASHDELAAWLRGLPLFRYFKDVTVTPLVGHPLYPHFDKPEPGAAAYESPLKK